MNPLEHQEINGITVNAAVQNVLLELNLVCQTCTSKAYSNAKLTPFLSDENYDEMINNYLRYAVVVSSLQEIPTYSNKILVILHDATETWDIGHPVWIKRLDYFSVASWVRNSREFYKGMLCFGWLTNVIFLMSISSPYARFIQPQVIVTDWNTTIPWFALALPSGVSVHAGSLGESCEIVCGKYAKFCSVHHFSWINTNGTLKEHFECQKVKHFTVKAVVPPTHFGAPGWENDGVCVTCESRYFNCNFNHQSVRRLCTCV